MHTSTQNYACRRGGEDGVEEGEVAGNKLTGTSFQYHFERDYPVGSNKGEEGVDEEQKDQQVRGHRQRFGSSPEESTVRTTPQCYKGETVLIRTKDHAVANPDTC